MGLCPWRLVAWWLAAICRRSVARRKRERGAQPRRSQRDERVVDESGRGEPLRRLRGPGRAYEDLAHRCRRGLGGLARRTQPVLLVLGLGHHQPWLDRCGWLQ